MKDIRDNIAELKAAYRKSKANKLKDDKIRKFDAYGKTLGLAVGAGVGAGVGKLVSDKIHAKKLSRLSYLKSKGSHRTYENEVEMKNLMAELSKSKMKALALGAALGGVTSHFTLNKYMKKREIKNIYGSK